MVNEYDGDASVITVEVAYAKPDEQVIVAVNLPKDATVGQAIAASGLLTHFPDIDQTTLTAGVFGAIVKLDQPLTDGDRVEIYRPLRRDPKDARRIRASKQ